MKRLRIKIAPHLRGRICREFTQNSRQFRHYFSEFVFTHLVSQMVSILVSNLGQSANTPTFIFLSAQRKGRRAKRPARAEMESMRACPLARVWAGVRPGARVWGPRKSQTTKKRLNCCQSSRMGVSDGQSSPNIITVMAGCGSSMSRGPQTAVNLTSRGARLSLRT